MKPNRRLPKDALDAAISMLGGVVATANRLPVKGYQVVQQWRISRVPAEHCPAIERATAGAVRCEELRPDVDWACLRESAGAKKSQRTAA